MTRTSLTNNQERHHKVSTGEQIPTGGGGQIQVGQNHLPPNSYFSSNFAHFILEILKNLKIFTDIHQFSLKIHPGGISPRISDQGDVSPIPPVAMPKQQCRHHEVLTGGTDSGSSNPPTPKFRFLLGFRSLCFENLEKSKNFG